MKVALKILMKHIYYRALFIITMITLVTPGTSQSNLSLTNDFHASRDGESKARLGLKLAANYMHLNHDSAVYFLNNTLDITKSSGLDSLYLHTISRMVTQLTLSNDFEEALSYLKAGKQKADQIGDKFYPAAYYNLSGRCYRYLQQYDSSIYYTLKFDELLVSQKREQRRWLPHMDLSILYYNLGDRENATAYMDKALDFARIKKRPVDYLYVLQEAIRQQEQYENLEKASDLSEEYLAFQLERGKSTKDLLEIPHHGQIHAPDVKNSDLEKFLLASIPVHAQSKNWLSLSRTCYTLGQIYVDKGDLRKAIAVYKQGAIAADSLGLQNLQSNMQLALYKAYKAAQMPEKALEHFEAWTSYRRDIQNLEKQKQMQDLNIKYDTEKKEHELAQTRLELDIAHQRQLFLIVGALGLALLLAFAFFAYRVKRKSNQQLSEKNDVITRALTEKDILLKEIHHRVKNNLQMISALLYLQGKSIDDPAAKDAIKESENRVQSMAMIHQKLYRNEDLLSVDVKEYLDRLFDHLFDSYNIDGDRITLRKTIDVQNLDIDTVIPLALIVNELVSNALKYAFKDGRQGEINVVLKEHENGILLSVKDNGIGLPEGFDRHKTINFGYKLIQILSDRLRAKWTVHQKDGTAIVLDIPKAA